ncbi:MAG: tetraacyldisaccharide 4'-kinase [Candidatus Omnitrophica bacterium]|nr:tetraacyldisaccharide 4'-kinase [Candidatus Omnitrophota bacterium]
MYSSLVVLKQKYLGLIQEKNRTPLGQALFLVLVGLSGIFWILVKARGLFYEKEVCKTYQSEKRIVSIGNISWGGTGKTSLTLYLYKTLQVPVRACIITKGYAKDEYALIRRSTKSVYDSRNRIRMIRRLEKEYDLFLLDDAFQYRGLARDLDIVLINKQEIITRPRLIPAGPLREPFSSLKRADIVIVSYCSKEDLAGISPRIARINKNAAVFAADYKVTGLLDHNLKRVPQEYLKGKKLGVLTAIGYPQGFLDKIHGISYEPSRVSVYPDHYEFSGEHLREIEREFLKDGIENVLITYKDYYHTDFSRKRLNYFIVQVELIIHDEEKFLEVVHNRIRSL